MIRRIFGEINLIFYKLVQNDYQGSKSSFVVLAFIIILILCIRIYSFDVPLPDRTAWKEIDYITISHNYTLNRFNFIEPTISWPAEPPNVTAMEFPLVPYIAAILYKIFGYNFITIRFTTQLAFILIIWVLFMLVKREIGNVPALFAATMCGFMPITSMFGNMLNSYPVAILTGLTSIFFFSKWLDNKKKYFEIISCCLISLTWLLMPTELVIIIPLLWLFFRKHKLDTRKWKRIILFFLIALILPIIWYSYVYFLTKHSIDVFGVFKGHDKYQSVKMLTSRMWYSQMFRRILILSSGMPGLFLVFVGLIVILVLKKGRLFLYYGISFAVFVIIVAEGNIDAPYRQFCGIPALSAIFGIGMTYLIAIVTYILKNITKYSLKSNIVIAIWVILTFSYMVVKNSSFLFNRSKYSPIHTKEWALSTEIKKHSRPGSKIITAGTYSIHKGGNDLSPVLYYYSSTHGWTLNKSQFSLGNIETLRGKGAVLFAAENISREKELLEFSDIIKKKYRIVFQNDSLGLLLLDLGSPL